MPRSIAATALARSQCRAEAGKDTGTVRFVDNDFTVIADLPKRVKWDQAKLQPRRRDHPHQLGR